MQSLSAMFDKAGGGYDCQSTNCNENDVSMLLLFILIGYGYNLYTFFELVNVYVTLLLCRL